MAFDPKKNRIRIHKSTIHMMGDPKYIDLLVNPEKMAVALKASEHDRPGKDAHHIWPQIMDSGNSCEIYSRAFLSKLFEIVGGLSTKCSYRLTGTLIPSQRMAVYSLKTIARIDP